MKTISHLWREAHLANNLSRLSGCRPPEQWEALKITPARRDVVMEIGIGMGYSVRALVEMGCDVTAVDVCAEALDRVTGADTLLADDMHTLPDDHFDLAYAGNVVQHLNTPDLLHNLREVIRALKPTGLYALNLAYHDTVTEMNDADSYPIAEQIGGSCWHTPVGVRRLAEEVGAAMQVMASWQVPPHHCIASIVHLRRAQCRYMEGELRE